MRIHLLPLIEYSMIHTNAQRIFDEQMQYMANPFLMPELMEPIQGLASGLRRYIRLS